MRKLSVIDVEDGVSQITGKVEYLHTLQAPEISMGKLFKQTKKEEHFWIWSEDEIPVGSEFLWDTVRNSDGMLTKLHLYDVEDGDLLETFDVYYKKFTDDDGVEKTVRKLYVEGQAPAQVESEEDDTEEEEEVVEESKPEPKKKTTAKKSTAKA